MPRGGDRRKIRAKAEPQMVRGAVSATSNPDAGAVYDASASGVASVEYTSPIDYMLAVLNDRTIDDARRDRMAIAMAPYFATKAGELGKKEIRAKRAKEVGLGKFAPAEPPSLQVVRK